MLVLCLSEHLVQSQWLPHWVRADNVSVTDVSDTVLHIYCLLSCDSTVCCCSSTLDLDSHWKYNNLSGSNLKNYSNEINYLSLNQRLNLVKLKNQSRTIQPQEETLTSRLYHLQTMVKVRFSRRNNWKSHTSYISLHRNSLN